MKGDVSQNLVKITHWIQLHKTHPNSCITTVKVTQSSVWRVSPSMESVQTRVVHVKIFYPWPALFNKDIVIDPHHVGGGVEELYATPVVNGQSWSQPFTLKSHHLLPICGKYIYISVITWGPSKKWLKPISEGGGDGGFFLPCEDFGNMFHHSFSTCTFFFKVEISLHTHMHSLGQRAETTVAEYSLKICM